MSTLAIPSREVKTARVSAAKIGYVISALPILFLAVDAAFKFTGMPEVVDSMTQLGWNMSVAPVIAIIELVCLALYVVPRTSILGAILLTGYLGGAIATHIRVENPLFSHVLFPIYVAAFIWGGLYLRDARVRSLVR
jgi:hypothetical protein